MLVLAFSDLFDGQSVLFLLLVRPPDLAGSPLSQLAEDQRQGFHTAVVVFLAHRGADLGFAKLHLALFGAPQSGFSPRRYTIEEIPVFERHSNRGSSGYCLTEDPQTLGVGIA